MFSKAILFSKNSTVKAVWERLRKVSHFNIGVYSDLNIHLGITKHLNITKYISEDIKLKKRDDDWRKWEKKYKKILGDSFFYD